MYQELKQNIPTVTYVIYHVQSTWIFFIYARYCTCCAVLLFFSNVALIICYQYHIKIQKRSCKNQSPNGQHSDSYVMIITLYNVALGTFVISEDFFTTNAEDERSMSSSRPSDNLTFL